MSVHEDYWTGRVTYLGTGIGTLAGAKRDLKRRFGQSPLPPIQSRPGARFYVTMPTSLGVVYLLGPYASHMTALAAVPRARHLVHEAHPNLFFFLSLGTASRPDTVPTRYGR